jgi:hypothetical protein
MNRGNCKVNQPVEHKSDAIYLMVEENPGNPRQGDLRKIAHFPPPEVGRIAELFIKKKKKRGGRKERRKERSISFDCNEMLGINLPLFSSVLPSNSCCFCPVGLSLLIQHFQQVLWTLKLLQDRDSSANHMLHLNWLDDVSPMSADKWK